MTNREEVFRAIDSERAYQDSLWSNPDGSETPNPLEVGEFLLLIEEYASKARAIWVNEPKKLAGDRDGKRHYCEVDALEFLRKIAAIAVNGMEQHGAPQRVGFER